MTHVWNNVTVYGLAVDIRRFQRECISAEEEVVARHGQSGWDGCACTISVPASVGASEHGTRAAVDWEDVWNFQQFIQEMPVEFSFSFDTYGGFPVQLFEGLAAHYPSLSFDCRCVEELDEFLGYGWFNPPPGGEDFRENQPVPDDFWINGGRRRSPEAEIAHSDRIDRLVQELITTSRPTSRLSGSGAASDP